MAAFGNVVKNAVLCGIYDSKKIAGARINVFGLYFHNLRHCRLFLKD